MIESTRHQQEEIQEAHRERTLQDQEGDNLYVEPLYGLASIAGHEGEAPVEESEEDQAEAEPGRAVEGSTNLTWGIVLGGALLLFLVAGILIWGVGLTYSAAIITQYPVK
jgi:hypothetical protein